MSYRKFIACLLSLLFVYLSIIMGSAESSQDEIRPTNIVVEDDGMWIDGEYYEPADIQAILDSSSATPKPVENITNGPKKSPAILAIPAGVYLIPGIGEVVITATGVILLAGATVAVGSWLGKKISVYLSNKENQEIANARAKIPSRLLDKNGKVKMGNFNKKVKKTNNYKEKGGWEIRKNNNTSHKGDKWKLYDNGKKAKRIASLKEDGTIVGK